MATLNLDLDSSHSGLAIGLTDHIAGTAWSHSDMSFRAMGTDAQVVVVGPDSESKAETARREVERLERLWSRFDPESEVSRLNVCAGQPLDVSAETIELVALAEYGHRCSSGRFDAMLGLELAAIGYDRSFDQLSQDGLPPDRAKAASQHQRPVIDRAHSLVTVAEGTAFDPGGIGKGLAADRIVQRLINGGAWGALVSLGGDVRVAGMAPSGSAWTVSVAHPGRGHIATVMLSEGALATSSTGKRRWTMASPTGKAVTRHHIIDPSTALPHQGGVEHATVIAGSAWWAEIGATTLVGSALTPHELEASLLSDSAAVVSVHSSRGREPQRLGGFERYECAPTSGADEDQGTLA